MQLSYKLRSKLINSTVVTCEDIFFSSASDETITINCEICHCSRSRRRSKQKKLNTLLHAAAEDAMHEADDIYARRMMHMQGGCVTGEHCIYHQHHHHHHHDEYNQMLELHNGPPSLPPPYRQGARGTGAGGSPVYGDRRAASLAAMYGEHRSLSAGGSVLYGEMRPVVDDVAKSSSYGVIDSALVSGGGGGLALVNSAADAVGGVQHFRTFKPSTSGIYERGGGGVGAGDAGGRSLTMGRPVSCCHANGVVVRANPVSTAIAASGDSSAGECADTNMSPDKQPDLLHATGGGGSEELRVHGRAATLAGYTTSGYGTSESGTGSSPGPQSSRRRTSLAGAIRASSQRN